MCGRCFEVLDKPFPFTPKGLRHDPFRFKLDAKEQFVSSQCSAGFVLTAYWLVFIQITR